MLEFVLLFVCSGTYLAVHRVYLLLALSSGTTLGELGRPYGMLSILTCVGHIQGKYLINCTLSSLKVLGLTRSKLISNDTIKLKLLPKIVMKGTDHFFLSIFPLSFK